MNPMKDYLIFNRFIMPFTLQFLFWSGVAGSLYGSWWLFVHGNWAWIMALIFGPLVTRLIFESLILRYKTYLCLVEIKEKLSDDR